MLPQNKLTVFTRNQDWRPEDTAEVERIVRQRWNDSYAPRSTSTQTAEWQQPTGPPHKVSASLLHHVVCAEN
jgi:hypothetical protein